MSDLISRQAAIEEIKDLPNCPNGFSDTYDKARIIGVLEDVPSYADKKVSYICPNSNCGCIATIDKTKEVSGFKFCPNCGMKMQQEETVCIDSGQSVAWPEEWTRQ